MSIRTHNALLIAYGCEPGRGSEPGIGWAHLQALSARFATWVLVHPDHEEPLRDAVGRLPGRVTVCPVDVPARWRWLPKAGYAGFNLYYYLWCQAAAGVARRLHEDASFALVQHASLTRWWMFSPALPLARQGVKFVWGPLGAGETVPPRLRDGYGWRGKLTEVSRTLARLAFSPDPRLYATARLADVALAEPRETVGRLRRLGARRVELAQALPCDPARYASVQPEPKPAGMFRLVSGGGLVYWKNIDLAVRAFADVFRGNPHAQYVHVCGGREEPALRRLARRLGVADQVVLAGEMPHARSLAWLASADACVHPATRDSIGLMIDALSLGVPVIAVGMLSAAVVVDETCGVTIDAQTCRRRRDLVPRFADAFRRLHEDQACRRRLADGSKQRSLSFSTTAFDRRMGDLYAQLLRGPAQSPVSSTATTPTPGSRRATSGIISPA